MPRPRFKQRCAMCKNNMVIMYSHRQFPICVECHMKQIDKPIEDAKMKKFFAIPRELYEESQFLRNIKGSYIRFGNLTEKQIAAFKKVVKELKDAKNKPKQESEESKGNASETKAERKEEQKQEE